MFHLLSRRPRFRPLEPWQRNQYGVVLAVGLAFTAFELSQPFIPLFIRDLGTADLAEAAFWSGLVAGVAPLGAAIMGPVWGGMADKYGRKPMVLRALVFIGVMQFSMAFVPNVQWLLAIRVLMGLFAGFTAGFWRMDDGRTIVALDNTMSPDLAELLKGIAKIVYGGL